MHGNTDQRKKGIGFFFENVFFPLCFLAFFLRFFGRGLLLFCWSMQKDICKADCD